MEHKAGNNKRDHGMAEKNGKEMAAVHTRFEGSPRKQKHSNNLVQTSGAVSSSYKTDSNPQHLECHDKPNSKTLRIEKSSHRMEGNEDTHAGTTHLKPSFIMESNTAAMNGDSKAEWKNRSSKKRKLLE